MVDGGTDNSGADRVIVLLKWTMCHMMESDLSIVTELDSNEEVKVQLALQQLSHRASELGNSPIQSLAEFPLANVEKMCNSPLVLRQSLDFARTKQAFRMNAR